MATALDRLFKAVEAVLAALLLGMVLMVFGNVVLRYVFNSGIVVSEELSRFCFVWLTFIGAIVAMRDGTHLGMDNVVAPAAAARQARLPGRQPAADPGLLRGAVLGHLAPARDQRHERRRRSPACR